MSSENENLLFAAGEFGLFYGGGIVAKLITRAVIPFNEIQAKCIEATQGRICNLLSNDSGPDAIQAFISSLGVAVALNELFPNLMKSPRGAVAATALVTFGFIILGEMVPVIFASQPFNYYDLAAETIGTIPTLIMVAKWS